MAVFPIPPALGVPGHGMATMSADNVYAVIFFS